MKLNLTGELKQYIALSDEYYKIRLFEFPELHSLYTNLAFRKRFVNYIYPVAENSLLVAFDDNAFFLIPQSNLVESENKGILELSIVGELKTLLQDKKLDLLSVRNGQEIFFKVGADKIYRTDLDMASHAVGSKGIELVYDAEAHGSGILLVLEHGGTFEAENSDSQSQELYVACMDDNDYLIKDLKVL